MWVKPPTEISQVIRVTTANLALSALGIIHTMAAIRKPDVMLTDTEATAKFWFGNAVTSE